MSIHPTDEYSAHNAMIEIEFRTQGQEDDGFQERLVGTSLVTPEQQVAAGYPAGWFRGCGAGRSRSADHELHAAPDQQDRILLPVSFARTVHQARIRGLEPLQEPGRRPGRLQGLPSA